MKALVSLSVFICEKRREIEFYEHMATAISISRNSSSLLLSFHLLKRNEQTTDFSFKHSPFPVHDANDYLRHCN